MSLANVPRYYEVCLYDESRGVEVKLAVTKQEAITVMDACSFAEGRIRLEDPTHAYKVTKVREMLAWTGTAL